MGKHLQNLWEDDGDQDSASAPSPSAAPETPAPRSSKIYAIIRNDRSYGYYNKNDLKKRIEDGQILPTDIIYSKNTNKTYSYEYVAKTLGAKKSDEAETWAGTLPGVKDEIKNSQWGEFKAGDSQSWEYVYNAANSLLNQYYYNRKGEIGSQDLTKILAQINAIKKMAGRWLNKNANQISNESTDSIKQAIVELNAARAFIVEYGSAARRQARLVRLQTRQVLDALRDDSKEEIAKGPFLDTKDAEEGDSKDEDKDK